MEKRTLAIRHLAFEDLGTLAPVLERRGHEIVCREASQDDLAAIDPLAPDLLVVLGGPIGVYESAAYPFLEDEIRLLERRLAAHRPTLGICLGGQLIARALGARVYPGPAKEIGWAPLALTEAGTASPLRHLGDNPVLHWHGDTFDLPAGAALLASTPAFENQAFVWGERVLALQFHIEVTATGLERWFVGHAAEIAATPGVEVPMLRADSRRWAPPLEPLADRVFREWLDAVGV